MTTQDVRNIKKRYLKGQRQGRNDAEQLSYLLSREFQEKATSSSIYLDSNDYVNHLIVQTERMSQNLLHYSEVLFIDCTHKLNKGKYPVVVFMVADENNRGLCVGYAIVRDETSETLGNLLNDFMKKKSIRI